MRSLIPLSLLLTIFDTPVHAIVFPFHVRFGNPSPSSALQRRSPVPIKDIGNAQYVSNLTIAGVTLPVLLDTGSSDLWVHFPNSPPTSSMTDLGKSITLAYAVGNAPGEIVASTVQLANTTVNNQAYLFVNDTSKFTANINAQGYSGLLGLGPNEGSMIQKKINGDAGDNLLQNIFQQDKATDNYITVMLNRINDPGTTLTGQFTISEVVPEFSNVTSMPKLDVETVNRLLKSDQHWQALTDKDQGVIGPDGSPIQMSSIVPKAPDGQYVAVLDSGYTFSQVPRAMSDAIYGRVQGAYYDTTNQWWVIPCGQYLNVSFNFGGHNFPIHPLDLVDDNFAQLDSTGKKVCIGSFQPITSAFSLLGSYDMILGMSFLRSAYVLLNYGDWISGSSSQDSPYMQMVSTVDAVAARQDFINVRLSGNDTISTPRWTLLPANETQHSPISAEEKKKMYQEKILSHWPYIFIGCLAVVLISVGLCIWKCCCKRCRHKKGDIDLEGTSGKKGFSLFKKKEAKRESYVQLESKNQSSANLVSPHVSSFHQNDSTPAFPTYPPDQGDYHRNSYSSYRSQQSYNQPQQSYNQPQQGYQSYQGYPQAQYPQEQYQQHAM
ncbi:aspartic peptidase domain-containing protein [Gymnopilus junonius]|uniref:Aspartic peptidase domain-containing protein n=1 Tax=Gymnopilus junonius TaxID=109634 RepID=A0A9P5NT98_GYMJU|nr:aspartic peptidase domain-containing protein [Gymnopilus junonius]